MPRARGIDISKWQESFTFPNNFVFIIVKATEGLYTDPKFETFQSEVDKVPIRGAYHYYRTGYNPIQQAEYFYNATQGKGFHFLVVDYEKYNNELDEAGEQGLREFWVHLESLADETIVLYTSPYVFRDNLCSYNDMWKSVPLWMAHYNDLDPHTGEPEIFDGTGWEIWQYYNEGGGPWHGVGSRYVDTNVFNGDQEEMEEWLGIGGVQPEPCPGIREATIHECINKLRELL